MSTSRKRKLFAECSGSGDAGPEASKRRIPVDWDKCIFCQQKYKKKSCQLTNICSDAASQTINGMAANLPELMTRIAGEDLVARNAAYHALCHREYAYLCRSTSVPRDKSIDPYSAAFDEFIETIDHDLMTVHRYFEMSELNRKFQEVLDKYTSNAASYRSNNLKCRLLKHYGDRISIHRSRKVTDSALVFSSSINLGDALRIIKTYESGDDDFIFNADRTPTPTPDDGEMTYVKEMAHVAVRLRHDLLKHDEFTGLKVSATAAQKCVPKSVQMLLAFIDGGQRAIDHYLETNDLYLRPDNERKLLSIGQDLVYNIAGKSTPKHIGLGMTLHQRTRSKKLIQLFANAGHIITYDKIRRYDTGLATQTLKSIDAETGGIVPGNMVHGVPVHFSADNFDLVDESLTGANQFHATNISIYQRGPSKQSPLKVMEGTCETTLSVPDSVLELTPAPKINDKLEPPYESIDLKSFQKPKAEPRCVSNAKSSDDAFLLMRQELEVRPSWTSFNESISTVDPPVTTVGYLPMINAEAHDYDTLNTTIRRCQYAVNQLGGTYTIITVDQALFPKMMELKWTVDEYKDRLIVRLGGLHVALNFLEIIGKHMEGAGLHEMWVESGLFVAGTAHKSLHGNDYNKAMRGHKLTFQALWRKLLPQFLVFIAEHDPQLHTALSDAGDNDYDTIVGITSDEKFTAAKYKFAESRMADPNFKFWWDYLEMVQLLLLFTRSERDGIWSLYMYSFKRMMPYFFRYDHQNYARWGTIFVREMENLPREVIDMFENGDFVVKRSRRKFNQVDPDHAQEWVNGRGKSNGGIIGIQKTTTALARWSLTFPYRSEISSDTLQMMDIRDDEIIHVESTTSRTAKDNHAENSLLSVIHRFGIFDSSNTHEALLNVATKDVATQEIQKSLLNAEQLGIEQLIGFANRFNSLEEEDVQSNRNTFRSAITRNNAATFDGLYRVQAIGSDDKTTILKADRDISRRLIASYASGRKIDLASITRHELMSVPISIFETNGIMKSGNKSILMETLLNDIDCPKSLQPITGTSHLVIDAQAVVCALGGPDPGMKTFRDMAAEFCQRVRRLSSPYTRVDIIFDRYNKTSLKSSTRKRRAKNHRPIRKVVDNGDAPLPADWSNFMALGENKADFAKLLSHDLIRNAALNNKTIVAGGGFLTETDVRSNDAKVDVEALCCDHEEADTRIVFHAANMKANRIVVKARDTDILLLLVAHFDAVKCDELWIDAGTASQPKFVPVWKVVKKLGPDICRNILAFHALSGSDITSFIAGHTKKTMWEVFLENWKLLEGIGSREVISERHMKLAEEFLCRCYNVPRHITETDKARAILLPRGVKPEHMPATSDAISLHIRRAHYATLVWNRAVDGLQQLPAPDNYGWRSDEKTQRYVPVMTTLTPIPKGCIELVTCNCKTGCRSKRCSCRQAGLQCSQACGCFSVSDTEGKCSNTGHDHNN